MGRLKTDLRSSLDPRSLAANVMLKANADLTDYAAKEVKEVSEIDETESFLIAEQVWNSKEGDEIKDGESEIDGPYGNQH